MAQVAMVRVLLTLVALAVLGAPASPAASPKTLRWRSLDVVAHLDAQGDLHVSERHAMVFSGAWNGGERLFNLRRGQRLTFERLLRADPGDAEAREVRRGSLDEVDRWAFTDARTLRWRSRAASDPEFAETEIDYVLEYVLSGVLVPEGDRRYRLSHDFAFPDRQWPIERFTARLDLDPSWQVEAGTSLAMEARDLAPGAGFVATIDLARDAASPPLQVRTRGAPVAVRIALAAFFALGLCLTAFAIIRHARARGQFAPLPTGLDEAWLREHVFAFPPEVIGAAWDRNVSAPEVSAVLARMALEGKIQGRATSVRSWFGRTREQNELRLCVSRDTLSGRERALVDGIFVDGDSIDPDRLRAHYKGRGFDPADLLRGDLEKEVARLIPDGEPVRKWPLVVSVLLLFVLGQAVMFSVALLDHDASMAVGLAVLSQLPMLLVLATSLRVQRTVVRARASIVAVLLVLAGWAGVILWAARADWEIHPLALVACAALWACGAAVAVWVGRTRSSATGIAVRRRLAAARAYLARELKAPRPRLDDAWAPYLAALGLGPQLDRWVRVHGANGTAGVPGSRGGSPGVGSGNWTGGGGSFSGGGATGTWTALAGISTAIPSPSSSSSGGGGGGGGSSGGGGGGGW
jgi:uncharacterized membrane protein YgcG